MTVDKRECKCFICSMMMPVRSGSNLKMGGKLRFICEVCRNTICRPLKAG